MSGVDMTPSTAEVWRQLYLTYSTIFKAIERAIQQTGVTLPQALALTTIQADSEPTTPSRLAHHLTQETQSVTGLIDRMEKQDWVRRMRDLPDRRAIRLELTAAGEAKLEETAGPSRATEARVFDQLSPDELATLSSLLDRVYRGAVAHLSTEPPKNGPV
jgi:MarR family 2-MHQ and catechol resistance regulon transcriptional repressor